MVGNVCVSINGEWPDRFLVGPENAQKSKYAGAYIVIFVELQKFENKYKTLKTTLDRW
jgi:hypothetical protein